MPANRIRRQYCYALTNGPLPDNSADWFVEFGRGARGSGFAIRCASEESVPPSTTERLGLCTPRRHTRGDRFSTRLPARARDPGCPENGFARHDPRHQEALGVFPENRGGGALAAR